jgi:hypothetical protein
MYSAACYPRSARRSLRDSSVRAALPGLFESF